MQHLSLDWDNCFTLMCWFYLGGVVCLFWGEGKHGGCKKQQKKKKKPYFYQLLFVLSWLGQNMPAHTSCITVHHCNTMQLQTVTPKTVCAS